MISKDNKYTHRKAVRACLLPVGAAATIDGKNLVYKMCKEDASAVILSDGDDVVSYQCGDRFETDLTIDGMIWSVGGVNVADFSGISDEDIAQFNSIVDVSIGDDAWLALETMIETRPLS